MQRTASVETGALRCAQHILKSLLKILGSDYQYHGFIQQSGYVCSKQASPSHLSTVPSVFRLGSLFRAVHIVVLA